MGKRKAWRLSTLRKMADGIKRLEENIDALHRQYDTLSDAHHRQGQELAGLVETIAEVCPYSVLLPPKKGDGIEFGEHERQRYVNLLKKENRESMLSWGLAGDRAEPWACIPYRQVELRLVEVACASEPVQAAVHMLVKVHGTAAAVYAVSRDALAQMRLGREFRQFQIVIMESLWKRLREAINGPWR